MYRNSALLSIGATVVSSLFFFGVGHAFQIDRNQNAGTASLPSKQVSNTPTPCGGKTGITCRTQSLQGSGVLATAGSRYTSHGSNTPTPCGGRTGVSCTQQSQPGSEATATDGARDTSASLLAPLPLVGILFGAGFIALVGIGVRGWRHNHGHHA